MNRKRIYLTYCSICLFLTAGSVNVLGQEFPEADIPAGSVQVDWVVDAIWDTVPEQTLSVDIDGTSPVAPDFAGYWKGLWDVTNLYLLLVTVDDVTVSYPGSQFWLYDMTEVFIDPDNSKGQTYDGINDSQFVWPRDGAASFGHSNPLGVTIPFSSEGLVQGSGTVVVEVALPWSELGVIPSPGTQIGLDVYMKDNDSGLAARDNQISWSPSGDNAWRYPYLLGTVTLVDQVGQSWNGYPVDKIGWADTGSWLGWVNVTFDPHVWVYGLARYIYVLNDSGWVYIAK